MANAFIPYIRILAEDDKNRQIINGFINDYRIINARQIEVLPLSRGWANALEYLKKNSGKLTSDPHLHIVIVIDFDNDENRREAFNACLPDDVRSRVLILGSQDEAEDLCTALKLKPEAIGVEIAKNCDENSEAFWKSNPLLENNLDQIKEKRELFRSILGLK